jgi:hypothetical protein
VIPHEAFFTRYNHSSIAMQTAWTKEVDKMIGWGAVVPGKEMLIGFLAAEYSNTKPLPLPALSAAGAAKK